MQSEERRINDGFDLITKGRNFSQEKGVLTI
jgi:hypothetical protein